MTKKQQKWIALLVTLTFAWMLQVSARPLAAAGTVDAVSSANGEQGSGFLEAAGNKAAPAPKKSLLPYVLIGVGVAAVAAVLFLVVLKTDYDITGEWTMNYSVPGSPTVTGLMTFSGDKKSGTTVLNTTPGEYIVDGKKVTINLRKILYDIPRRWEFIGEFKAKDRIEGDFKFYDNEVYKPQYDTTFSLDRN
ncbi:MAG: hypothetical protein NTW95_09540 [Candidatus Aminicenantes bacterium]|nr:hypothetical protein [Candidatus Aminicenantes bacterium]